MITEDEFIEKVSELMDKTKTDAIEKARHLYNSGAINTNSYENNYELPKLFLVAYADTLKSNWYPVVSTPKRKREIKNFKYFI